jgi:hypothetical protein
MFDLLKLKLVMSFNVSVQTITKSMNIFTSSVSGDLYVSIPHAGDNQIILFNQHTRVQAAI